MGYVELIDFEPSMCQDNLLQRAVIQAGMVLSKHIIALLFKGGHKELHDFEAFHVPGPQD